MSPVRMYRRELPTRPELRQNCARNSAPVTSSTLPQRIRSGRSRGAARRTPQLDRGSGRRRRRFVEEQRRVVGRLVLREERADVAHLRVRERSLGVLAREEPPQPPQVAVVQLGEQQRGRPTRAPPASTSKPRYPQPQPRRPAGVGRGGGNSTLPPPRMSERCTLEPSLRRSGASPTVSSSRSSASNSRSSSDRQLHLLVELILKAHADVARDKPSIAWPNRRGAEAAGALGQRGPRAGRCSAGRAARRGRAAASPRPR